MSITTPADILPLIEQGVSPTAQQVFEAVASHLFAQGTRAIREGVGGASQCAYRGEHGRKCAFGALLPDRFYVPVMDTPDYSAADLLLESEIAPVPLAAALSPHTRLLVMPQADHDDPSWDVRQILPGTPCEAALRRNLADTAGCMELEAGFLDDLHLSDPEEAP